MEFWVLFTLFMYGCTPCPTVTKHIVSVGGCSADGRCGVLYADGSVGKEYYPVVGQSVEVCK